MAACHYCLRNDNQAVLLRYPLISYYRDLLILLEHANDEAYICAECLKREVRFTQREAK